MNTGSFVLLALTIAVAFCLAFTTARPLDASSLPQARRNDADLTRLTSNAGNYKLYLRADSHKGMDGFQIAMTVVTALVGATFLILVGAFVWAFFWGW